MAVADTVLEREKERERERERERLIRSTLVKYVCQRIYRYGKRKRRERERERVPREGNSHYAFEMVGTFPTISNA